MKTKVKDWNWENPEKDGTYIVLGWDDAGKTSVEIADWENQPVGYVLGRWVVNSHSKKFGFTRSTKIDITKWILAWMGFPQIPKDLDKFKFYNPEIGTPPKLAKGKKK